MIRPPSSDVPYQAAQRRMGIVRRRVNAITYRISIDNATITAVSPTGVALVRGQRIPVRFDPEKRYWIIEARTASKQVCFHSFITTPSTTVVQYQSLDRNFGLWSATQNLREIMVSAPGTLSHLAINVTTAPGAGKSYAFEVLIAGLASGLIVTIADSATSGVDTVNAPAVTAGQRITLRSTPSGTPASTGNIHISWQFTPTTPGAIYASRLNGTLSATAVRYVNLGAADGEPYSSRPLADSLWALGGTMDALYVSLNSAPGAGRSFAFDLMRNGIVVGSTLTIAGTDTAGSLSALGLTITDMDLWALRITPAGTPTLSQGAYGVAYTPTSPGQWSLGAMTSSGAIATDPAYDAFSGTNSWSAAETDALQRILLPAGGAKPRVLGLRMDADVAPGVGFAPAFTMRRESANAAIEITLTGIETTASATGSVALADGDDLALRISGPEGALNNFRWAWQMRA